MRVKDRLRPVSENDIYADEINKSVIPKLKKIIEKIKRLREDPNNFTYEKAFSLVNFSGSGRAITRALIKNEVFLIEGEGLEVIKFIENLKTRGKLKHPKFNNIELLNKKGIKEWTKAEALLDFREEVEPRIQELKKGYDDIKENFEEYYNRSVRSDLKKSKKLLRAGEFHTLNEILKKKVKRVTKANILNARFAAYSKAEWAVIKSSRFTGLKTWFSQFDLKVRNGHDLLNHKSIPIQKRFRAIYFRGVDWLYAPKIPPISPENLINCRCWCRYQIDGVSPRR